MVPVGFGDFSPQSVVGRWVGLIWMVLGVLANVNLVTSLGDVIDEFHPAKTGKRKPPKFCRELFERIDKDNNNALSRAEFYAWMLVTENLVTEDVFARLDKIFERLDTNNTGKLEYSLLAERFSKAQ